MVLYLCTNICINTSLNLPWSFLDIPFEQALNRNNPVSGLTCWMSSSADLSSLARGLEPGWKSYQLFRCLPIPLIGWVIRFQKKSV
jgi:hypothetical protein